MTKTAKTENDIPDDMIKISEAAEMLGVSYNTVRRAIDAQHLRAVRYPVGGIMVSRAAVKKLFDNSEYFAIQQEKREREALTQMRAEERVIPDSPMSTAELQEWRMKQYGQASIPGDGAESKAD